MRRYRIFISHSWSYDEYERILKFLDEDPEFTYSNYSVPANNSLAVQGEKRLKESLRNLIKMSQIVLVPAGMETNNSRWIQFELTVAYEMDKPIVGIIPNGYKRVPNSVKDKACAIVGWRRNSIMNAIYDYSL